MIDKSTRSGTPTADDIRIFEQLCNALREGEPDDVQRSLITSNFNFSQQNSEGETLLHLAAQYGRCDFIEFLLVGGGSTQKRTKKNSTALHYAVTNWHAGVLDRLLDDPVQRTLINKKDLQCKTALIRAVENEDGEAVMALLNSGADPKIADRSGRTVLHIAVEKENLNIIEILLAHDNELIKLKDKKQTLPLHLAAAGGDNLIVERLLRGSYGVNVADGNKVTPLMRAVIGGHSDIVELLLEQGAEVNEPGLLHKAIKTGQPSIVVALLAGGMDVSQVESALLEAVIGGNLDIIQALLNVESLNVHVTDKSGNGALHIAAKKGDLSLVQILLDHPGWDVNARNASHNTPLYLAASNGHKNVVEALLGAKNANPNLQCSRGETALHIAVSKGRLDIVQALLAVEGIDLNLKKYEGKTPLHIAVSKGRLDIVQALLAVECIDLNLKNHEGDTPLHLAVMYGHSAIVLALLTVDGVDLNVRNRRGNSAVNIASNPKMLLNTYGYLVEDATPSELNAWLNTVGNVDSTKHGNGSTLLHFAVKFNRLDIATELLKQDANPNILTYQGNTALCIAVNNGHVDMVSLLLNHNADSNAQNHHKMTPLYLALKHNAADAIINALIEAGADIHCSCQGETPLCFAIKEGHVTHVEQLLKSKKACEIVTSDGPEEDIQPKSFFHRAKITLPKHPLSLACELSKEKPVEYGPIIELLLTRGMEAPQHASHIAITPGDSFEEGEGSGQHIFRSITSEC